MKRLIGFSVMLAVLLSVMPAAPAQASIAPSQSYTYFLANQGSGLCLQPEIEAQINGLGIVQQPCNQYNWYQRWYFWPRSYDNSTTPPTGTYLIVNFGGGLCLDDRDGKTADGSPVQQWTCNAASTTMQWKLNSPWNPFAADAQFKNVRSGKCLDVRWGSGEPGAVLQIYHCTSTASSLNLAQVFYWVYPMPRNGQ